MCRCFKLMTRFTQIGKVGRTYIHSYLHLHIHIQIDIIYTLWEECSYTRSSSYIYIDTHTRTLTDRNSRTYWCRQEFPDIDVVPVD